MSSFSSTCLIFIKKKKLDYAAASYKYRPCTTLSPPLRWPGYFFWPLPALFTLTQNVVLPLESYTSIPLSASKFHLTSSSPGPLANATTALITTNPNPQSLTVPPPSVDGFRQQLARLLALGPGEPPA